jgi:two-component system, response regulator YesN
VLKLVLVDDEPDVVAGLRSVIDWRRLGIEVVGDARDGVEGLELIRRTRPDIVMTDIRMPGADGLALIESARRLLPDVAALVFTGYSEFRYAKTAITLGVSEYLQKPVSVEAVEAALRKATAKATEAKLLRLSREQVLGGELRRILDGGPVRTEEMERVFRGAGIDPTGIAGTAVAVVRPEPALESTGTAVADRLRGSLSTVEGRIVLLPDGAELLLVASGEGGEEFRADLTSRLRRAAAACEADGIGVFVGLGRWYEGLAGASRSYREALEAARYAAFARKGVVVRTEQLEFARGIPPTVRACMEDLLLHVREGGDKAVQEDVERFLACLRGVELSPDGLRHEILALVFRVLRLAEETGRDYQAEKGGDFVPHRAVAALRDADSLDRWAAETIRDVVRWIGCVRAEGGHKSILTVTSYLQAHYNRDVTLKTLADMVGMNPSYLSVLFKRETRMTYQRYLADLRIEHAKRLLDGGAKAWEAGRAVGYYSFRHFAEMFRRQVGETPFEYRSRGRKKAPDGQNSSTQSPPSSQ